MPDRRPFCRSGAAAPGSRVGVAALIAIILSAGAACRTPAVLTQHAEARQLASELQIQFTRSADAGNVAVMADTDEASKRAAADAREATAAVERAVTALRAALTQLGYTDVIARLDDFQKHFSVYKGVDDEILGLAVENTNLKAQQLSFGPAQEAADAIQAALNSLTAATPAQIVSATQAVLAVREIQVMQARHIAESDEAAMTRMESEMAQRQAAARAALATLALAHAHPAAVVTTATGHLDRFMAINGEIVALSRRNTNVRSLALSLGRKRTLTAEANDSLQALQDALATHDFKATR